MDTIKKLLIGILLIAMPGYIAAQKKTKNLETVKYSTSIDCDECVNKIMTNIPQQKGIKDVKCDLKTKEVAVTYQMDKNNPAEIRKSIEKLGFTAKEVKPETKK